MEIQKPNAVIMAAGTSSRFVPLSVERPKGLLEVKGEVLIERQIRQLREAGIYDIVIVVGYKAPMFSYLRDKFGVSIVMNEDYLHYNNTSSLIRVADRLYNTFICSSDNYFVNNPFTEVPHGSYYSALYADGPTGEYCITADSSDIIKEVTIGGQDAWYMVGHVYFSEEFSKSFSKLLVEEYEKEEVKLGYWEDLYIKHLMELPPMAIKRFGPKEIYEFDSLDELRIFDKSYITDTRSKIIKEIARNMGCSEADFFNFAKISHTGDYLLFSFQKGDNSFIYNGDNKSIEKL